MPPEETEDISIDMTQARTLEPLPPGRPYLMAVTAWTPGRSAAGGRKVHYELTVAEPTDFANRKVMEDLSLDNEYTLGRLMTLLLALGMEEDEIRTKSFKLPKGRMYSVCSVPSSSGPSPPRCTVIGAG